MRHSLCSLNCKAWQLPSLAALARCTYNLRNSFSAPASTATRSLRAPQTAAEYSFSPPGKRQVSETTNAQIERTAASSANPAGGPSRQTSWTVSADAGEIERFTKLAAEWWNPKGPFRALHALNTARTRFLRDAVAQHFGRDHDGLHPLDRLSVVDVGCGGGVLAEPMARLGGHVLGIDLAHPNIKIACSHAQQDPLLLGKLAYEVTSAEALVEQGKQYDVVVCSEVIEHVKAPAEFCKTLANLRGPDGCIIITTINRTPEAFALAIVAAEKILGMAPDGTHDWSKFISPEELQLVFGEVGLNLHLLCGMQLGMPSGRWKCAEDTSVNYAAMFAPGECKI
jgi:ubiquinone biosynthesis O-methyltransferase